MFSVPSLEPKEDRDGCQQPKGDNARKGAVKKRSQTKTTIGGAAGYTKRDRASGEFMAVKANQGKKGRQEIQGRSHGKESSGQKDVTMKPRRTIWTDEDQAKLATMLDAGASAQRISVALRRPLDSIKQRARALGKPFPHERDLARERKKVLSTRHV